jgi:outer membrane receptor protein involved in Fe transport
MSSPFKRSRPLLAPIVALLAAVSLRPAQAQGADDDGDDPTRPVTELVVTARRLDAARANVDPALGATTYSVTAETVESRPGNEAISVAKVLLQFPGVQADGSGQLRVRQAQGDLQYRINNVIIPEGASDLGESLSARIAQKITVVTGALPAQYGFQTGGVVSVTTKSGAYLDGGQLEGYGGGRGEGEAAFELGAATGATNLFLSGSFHRNPVGLAPPDGSAGPDHDRSDQADGFAYLDHVLDSQTRIGLILGLSDDRFQIPNARGLTASTYRAPDATFEPPLAVEGLPDARSEMLDDHRREANRFAVASLIRTDDKLTVQLAAFVRYSIVSRRADGVADILFKGLAYSSDERTQSPGAQAEAVYELADAHTLRFGLQFAAERQTSDARYQALPTDAAGRQTAETPLTFAEHSTGTLRKTSAFVQDEWRLGGDVTLNLGARLDATHGVRSEAAFSPRTSLVWQAPSGATFHVGYARYFLPAPLDGRGELTAEGLAGTTGAPPTQNGDPLRSEHDDYVDVGLQQSFEHLTLGTDAYARRARNFIAEGEFGPANLPATYNYGRAQIRGVELAATYDAGPLTGWANLALARGVGRAITPNQFFFTAAQLATLAARDVPLREDQRLTGSGGITYRKGRLTTSGSLLFGSGLPRTPPGEEVNASHLPAYVQADVSLGYRLDGWGGPLEARVDLINAFDARYRLRDGTGLGDGQAAWSPPRGLFVGLEQTF